MNNEFNLSCKKASFNYKGYMIQMVNITEKRVNVMELMSDRSYQYLEEYNTVEHAIEYVDKLVTIK